jgi:large repetitive protein
VILPALANDSDADGNPLTVTAASAANGIVTILPDGTVRYVPNANFNGSDTVTYTISDGQGGTATSTVTVTVIPVNDVPVAVNDTATTPEDAPVTIAVLANDSDADGNPLTITAATSPNGTVMINPDGTLTFRPNANFNGPTTITYTVSDGQGGTATATVAVTVTPVNDPPVARPDTATTPEDTPVTIAPIANDSDVDGNVLTIVAASSPNGTVVINANGTISFTPAPNFNGPTTISYTVSDGQGGTATTTVAVTVTPVNDVPVARNDTLALDENTSVRIPVLANDSDADGDRLTVTAASSPNGSVVINADGTISFTPTANFSGPTTITYTISDGRGGTSSATVTVNVRDTNALPVDGDEAISTIGGVVTTIPVLGNASDPDRDPLLVAFAVLASGEGDVVINADGTISYTPPASFQGEAVIRYIVSDGKGGFDVSFVRVSVTQASADINALIGGAKGSGIPDRATIDPGRTLAQDFISVPLIIDRTANEFRSLNPMAILSGERPLLTAVNGIAWLEGMDELGDRPVGQLVDHLDRVRDLRFGSDRLFDQRFGDVIAKSLTGFSARQLDTGQEQVLIESVMRDRILYMNMYEVPGDGTEPGIIQYRLRTANGDALPEWVSLDPRGTAIIEVPAGLDALHLIVDAVRSDGTVVSIPVVIQGGTGEIQLDREGGTMRVGALPLSQDMGALASAADTEILQLVASFGGR